MSVNDNHLCKAGDPLPIIDAHGRAALLLVESLIHGLCKNATLSAHGAVEIAERVVNVRLTHVEETEDDGGSLCRAYDLILSILKSLRLDDRESRSLRPLP